MSTSGDYSFTSDLLSTSQQVEVNAELPVLTPGELATLWENGKEFNDTTTNDVTTEDNFENDGMDDYLLQITDRQVAAYEEKQKATILSDVLIKPGKRPTKKESHPKLRNILEARPSHKTKRASQFYVAETQGEEEHELQKYKKIKSASNVPASLYPAVVVVNGGKAPESQNSERSVSPNPIAAKENREIPNWVSESDFTVSQKNAVTTIFNVGNKLASEIVELEAEDKRIERELCALNKKREWVRKNIGLKKNKLELLSSINFIK